MKDKIRSEIIQLASVMSVSGFEHRASEKIREIYLDEFDEIISDRVGNHLMIKRCGKDNATKIVIDAHFDEVGMLVSDVLEGGFLRIVNIGGIDSSILQSSDVVVYANSEFRGVVVSIPPHLRPGGDGNLPEVDEMLVDIGRGYTIEELREMIPIGSPVGFAPIYSEFGDGYLAGKSFDDKACAAIALRAVANTPKSELAGDVYVLLSAREEVANIGGVATACFNSEPDYAMVIDVNLGDAPDAPERETVSMGSGISISFSSATDRTLTTLTEKMCKDAEIACVRCAAPSSTGTNATAVNIVGLGIPVVDVGLPIRNMHTYNEVLRMDDALSLYSAVSEFVKSREIAERFGKEEPQ